jgi:long-chain acyl-CoA synthetase
MDSDDYLVVKGRFKSLLIGSDGEKYSPEGIEEALIDNSALIDQCMLHNNQDPYTVGLIVPNTAELKRQIKKQGFEPATEDGLEAGIKIVAHEIESYFGKGKHAGIFPERWLPSCFVILPEAFTEKNHMVNSTLKMVRGKINEGYNSTFAFLYTPAAKNPINTINKDNLRKLFSASE